jgi:hypothetical protein
MPHGETAQGPKDWRGQWQEGAKTITKPSKSTYLAFCTRCTARFGCVLSVALLVDATNGCTSDCPALITRVIHCARGGRTI